MATDYNDLVKPDQEKTPMLGKGLLRSKTFWVNVLTAVVSVGTYLTNSELLSDNPELVAIGGTIIGVANVILRLVTKEPITSVK